MINKKPLAGIILALTLFFWASAYVAIRVAEHSFSPGALGFFRYAIAALIMGPVYCLIPNKTKISRMDGFLIFISGAIGIGIYNVAVNQGELVVPAAMAAFIVASMPVVSSIGAAIFFKERITWIGILGLIISFTGVAVIALSQGSLHLSFTMGVGSLLFAVICAVFYNLMQKKLLRKFRALELSCLCILSACLIQIVFLPAGLNQIHQANISSVLAVLFLGVFPAAFSYLGYTYALTYFSITRTTASLFAMPFITLVIGWIVLGEKLPWIALIGGILTLMGPFLIFKYGALKSLPKGSRSL